MGNTHGLTVLAHDVQFGGCGGILICHDGSSDLLKCALCGTVLSRFDVSVLQVIVFAQDS